MSEANHNPTLFVILLRPPSGKKGVSVLALYQGSKHQLNLDHGQTPSPEFIRRFMLHILPKRFMRVRGYGLLANRDRKKRLQKAHVALGQFEAQEPKKNPESAEAFMLRVAGVDTGGGAVAAGARSSRRRGRITGATPMIRRPSIRHTFDTCGNRPQARFVVDWEQLTLSGASVIVGSGSVECETGSGGRRRSVGRANPAPVLYVGPAGSRYKPHKRAVRVPAVQFNRSYP